MTTFIPTNEVVEVPNYPYGYSLRTTLTDSMEFDKKKGYRHVTQTINPKNGRLNKPKKSTYSDLLVRYYDEKNHIKVVRFSMNGTKELNQTSKFLSENKHLFSDVEIQNICLTFIAMFKVDIKASMVYCGAKFDDLKPFYDAQISICVDGVKNPNNVDFSKVLLDVEKIDNCKVKDFNPFR